MDLSMRYKRDIHMKFDVPWRFMSKLLPLFISFYENHNKDCPLKKVEQFSKYSFGETGNQNLVISSYGISNKQVLILYERDLVDNKQCWKNIMTLLSDNRQSSEELMPIEGDKLLHKMLKKQKF